MGESGSGKTTLLKLLNKLIRYDSGEIYYQGKPLEKIDAVQLRRQVVMLPQTPAIFPGNIRDNLLIGLKFSEKPPVADNRLYEVLNMVNLNKNLTDPAENLSGGEKQRVTFCRVILMAPEVFLLDEPSSALDEETELKVIEAFVAHAQKEKKTVIMVTHTKKIASLFSDRIIEIKNGAVTGEEEVSRARAHGEQ